MFGLHSGCEFQYGKVHVGSLALGIVCVSHQKCSLFFRYVIYSVKYNQMMLWKYNLFISIISEEWKLIEDSHSHVFRKLIT
jgi:hypothetical protein